METKDGALVLSRPLHIPEHWELVWKCRSLKNKRCDKFRLSDQAGHVWLSWPVCLVWTQLVLFTDKSWCPSLSWVTPTSTQNNKLMYRGTELNLKYNLLIFTLIICTFRSWTSIQALNQGSRQTLNRFLFKDKFACLGWVLVPVPWRHMEQLADNFLINFSVYWRLWNIWDRTGWTAVAAGTCCGTDFHQIFAGTPFSDTWHQFRPRYFTQTEPSTQT